MRATLDTARLILRPFEPDDAEAAFGWLGDPLVMRFTPAGPDRSLDLTKARLAKYRQHQLERGYSKWVLLERGSARAVGDAGLLWLPEYDRIDLGFRLAQSHWGKGLATEAASAWVRAAFLDLRLERLTAFVHPRNLPSVRVLGKLGFAPQRAETAYGMDSILFSLTPMEPDIPTLRKPDILALY